MLVTQRMAWVSALKRRVSSTGTMRKYSLRVREPAYEPGILVTISAR